MTDTLASILSTLEARRADVVELDTIVANGMKNPQALYAKKAAMNAFTKAHDARKALLEPLTSWLEGALRARFTAHIASGTAQTLPEGFATPFVDRWNHVVTNSMKGPAFYANDVIEALVGVFMDAVGAKTLDAGTPLLDAATVESMIATGTVPAAFCGSDMLTNFWTGKSFGLSMDGWVPTIQAYRSQTDTFVPAAPRTDTAVFHAKVSFPTGRLIVADRLPFAQTEARIDAMGQSLNINYGIHRLIRSTMLMQEEQIVQISVGNSDPSFFSTGGHILVGHTNALDAQASVSTDLWMATVIDEATLHALGVTDSEIAQAIADGDAETFTVAPGTWHVFWSEESSQETFAERLSSLYDHTEGDEVAYVMTQNPDAVTALTTIVVNDLIEPS